MFIYRLEIGEPLHLCHVWAEVKIKLSSGCGGLIPHVYMLSVAWLVINVCRFASFPPIGVEVMVIYFPILNPGIKATLS